MQEHEWFILDAASCRRFNLGQTIQPGDYLGCDARNGRRMRSVYFGEIVGIEFDVDNNELILKVLPTVLPNMLPTSSSTAIVSSIATFSNSTLPFGPSA